MPDSIRGSEVMGGGNAPCSVNFILSSEYGACAIFGKNKVEGGNAPYSVTPYIIRIWRMRHIRSHANMADCTIFAKITLTNYYNLT